MGEDTDHQVMYTQAEVEMREAMARVQTMVSVTRDDFIEHKADDEKNFGDMFSASREISAKIDKIPKMISDCKDRLKEEIHKESKAHFVSQTDFKVFTTKVLWAIIGGTSAASVLAWILSILYTTYRLKGGI